jgi:hypothetical protein
MKRTLILLLAALVLPASAAAKGPSKAEVSGPGLGKALVVTGAEAPGTPLMTLAESAGFFPAVYGQSPDPMVSSRPKGDLGPRYSVVYRVPGPNRTVSTIRQDLYPYAKPFPASYMKPGQPFWQGQHTRGGWFVGDARLKSTLVRAGLAPVASTGGGGSTPWWIAGLVAGIVFVLAAAAVLVRRRPHGATAAEPT